jgi:hypothetical protein
VQRLALQASEPREPLPLATRCHRHESVLRLLRPEADHSDRNSSSCSRSANSSYDWARTQGTNFKPVQLVGERSTKRMHELRDLLSRTGILYELHEPNSSNGRTLPVQARMSADDLPAVFVIDAQPLPTGRIAEIAGAFEVNASMLEPAFSGQRDDMRAVMERRWSHG